ncbi:hypothetical protein K438DRAFT_1978362 [Mycena galopus ATCC 62051]|nr:hypothetical protein K438DRAFT_1978362 [Mycena galopus ATCC 62051]
MTSAISAVFTGSLDDAQASEDEHIHTSEDERQWAVYDVKWRQHRAIVKRKQEAQQRAWATQNKRDQWKVASAGYYERHPKVKEKKRLKAAEKQEVKKVSRRRWDPPKKAKCADDATAEQRQDLAAPRGGAALDVVDVCLGPAVLMMGPPVWDNEDGHLGGCNDSWALLAPKYDSEDD